ncbi:helix-turn-helix transcriptional regulator [Sphingobium yanoikuyae]|uniref:helix-turn-helix transcriptional regulator n=1 Tax=Sphingobium yanoikuyae TaxID=13690 RepID=UPI003B91C1E3
MPSQRDRRLDSIIRIATVRERTGLSPATIYRREGNGTFPPRVRLGVRSVGWYLSDIEDFIANPAIYLRKEDDS